MDTSSLFWAFGGVVAGNILVAMLSHWGSAVAGVLHTQSPEHRLRAVVLTSLFNSDPWVLVVAAIFVYYEHSAPWAPWFFGGAVVWVLFMAAVIGATCKRIRGRPKNAA